MNQDQSRTARFALGHVYATPGALEALETRNLRPEPFLARHVRGDWGELCAEDRQANDHAVRHGYRILSAYPLDEREKIWVITEADRSSTTLLLPSEY